MRTTFFVSIFLLAAIFNNFECFKLNQHKSSQFYSGRESDKHYLHSLIEPDASAEQLANIILNPSNEPSSNFNSFKKALETLASLSDNYNEEDEENQNNEDDDEEGVLDIVNADQRDEESESHSSLVAGHQYVSGGAGEGKQHLQPDGHVTNIEEVKSDEDLPAYCDPPNPCPLGIMNEDCDHKRAYDDYTAEFSKQYQDQQNCMCDDDHNECHKVAKNKLNEKDKLLSVVAKKSPIKKRN